ncbi:MAG: hypothetical protein WA957_08830 [Alteraurantiacibacter sp.]
MSNRSTLAFALPVLPVLLVLSACQDEPEVTVEDDGREASGEVLEGTISDEMIALDQVRSQAPLAEAEAEAEEDDAPAAEDEAE